MSVMAQVYAVRKTGNFLRRNLGKIIALLAILYIGYRINRSIGSFGNLFKVPTINLPQITLPQITLPEVQATPEQLNINPQGGTPSTGTGLIQVPESLVQDLTMKARETEARGLVPFTQPSGKIIYVTPETRERLSQRYYGQPFSYDTTINVNPNQYLPHETDVPRLNQMGLAIDMPTRMGQDTFVNRIVRSIQETERAQGSNTISTVVTLSGLSRQHPELTASQLADLRARLVGDFPRDFDFGTNTGAGRYMGQRLNPVLAAYEQYRAMYA